MKSILKISFGVILSTTIGTLLVTPRTAQAIPVEVINPEIIQYSLTDWLKEQFIDGIFWVLKDELISSITDSIKDWAATGFQGSPRFIQDPESFFAGVGFEASGVFMEDLGIEIAGDPNFLCSNFLHDILRLDIEVYGRRDYSSRARCTIDKVVDNLEGFYDDFNQGGWETFYKIQQRNNNTFGSYALALNELNRRNEEAEETFRLAAESGGGFLPSIECAERNAAGCRKWKILTPARTIADRVAAYAGSDIDRIIPADELSEIISAAIQGLIRRGLDDLAQ